LQAEIDTLHHLQFNEAMLLARSLGRKAVVTALAAGGFISFYEVTMLDSQHIPWAAQDTLKDVSPAAPGARLPFTVTAYCKGLVTSAGVAAQAGVAASDPAVLPLGSIIEMDVDGSRYDGIYSVVDTGPAVQGRELDIYMWSCYEALDFGRQPARVTVLRLGWNPKATTPSFMQRLFKRPEPPREPPPIPSRPLSIQPTEELRK
jgi:3D (Asp-Asp-Asp) domain-containing protein